MILPMKKVIYTMYKLNRVWYNKNASEFINGCSDVSYRKSWQREIGKFLIYFLT